jgi:HD-GYP domain-containing protein (c-di-GMP phosphodiesterase class II)
MLKNKPRKVDLVEKVKLRVSDLRPGMYVCELDRPWLDTPFLLQGFELENESDIDALAQCCEFVYIDLLRTKVVKNPTLEKDAQKSQGNPKNRSFDQKDLEAASTLHKRTSSLIKNFLDEIRFGQCPDIQLAKAAVAECLDGVLNNPDAMLFFAHMRNKDEYTVQHAYNVCIFSLVIGRLLGWDTEQLENLGTCGMLHDVGKVNIPDFILNKPDKLTPVEMQVMQSHTTEGRDILMSGRNIFSGAVDVAYCHHEHLDGTGYPRGFQGHQLNTNTLIVAVADKYDAITSQRPYRAAYDHLTAVATLNKMAAANHIDSKITSGFFSYLGIYPPGTIVELSSGEIGIVIDSHPDQRLRPQILVVRDHNRELIQRWVDLSEKKLDERGRPYRIVTVHRQGDFGIDISDYFDTVIKVFN